MMSVKKYICGFVFNGYLFFTSFFGALFMLGPAMPLLYVSPRWFRWYVDICGSLWLVLPGALFEYMHGTKVTLCGDAIGASDRALIIANHRCRLDWMFYWMVQLRLGRLSNTKIVLKKDLKWLPGPGWCMQCLMFLFLERRWDQDKEYLNRVLGYFIDQSYPLQLFIFPEGTDLNPGSIGKSNEFAEKHGLPKYDYVLHPRVTGFVFLVQKLRDGGIDFIHDVTIGYPSNLCYGEVDVLRGNFPDEVHVFIKRYHVNDLPNDQQGIQEWCQDRWAEKEERLRKFYKNKKFVGDEVCASVSSATERKAKATMCFAILCWTLFLILSFYCLFVSVYVRVYSLALCVFFVLQGVRGGFDALQLDLYQ